MPLLFKLIQIEVEVLEVSIMILRSNPAPLHGPREGLIMLKSIRIVMTSLKQKL